MSAFGDLLLNIVRNPQQMGDLTLRQWDALLPQARSAQVASRLAAQAEALRLTTRFPARVQVHFEANRRTAERQEQQVRWEVACLERVLAPLDQPVILLKGASYLFSAWRSGQGRTYSDVDLMVARIELPRAERLLLDNGWIAKEFEPHEERYYRRWLHELPPFFHEQRKTTLDLHHNILPRIDKLCRDPAPLFAAARPIADGSRFHVLAPVDQVLHNAAHLFRNGDYTRGLRDLADLNDLLRHYGEADFFDALAHRAGELRLTEPLYFAVRYVTRYFAPPLPEKFTTTVRGWRPIWPPLPPLPLMDALVDRAIRPRRFDGRNRRRDLANWVLNRYPLNLWSKTIRPKLERLGMTSKADRAATL